MDFKKKLKQLMTDNNVSMYRLAKEIGVHQSTVKNWTDGSTAPKFDKLGQLAAYFQIPIADLVDETGDSSASGRLAGPDTQKLPPGFPSLNQSAPHGKMYAAQSADIMNAGLSPEKEKELLPLFESLTESERRQAIEYMHFLKTRRF
jgi:transcriptional regulator with XRE-family HTH domain